MLYVSSRSKEDLFGVTDTDDNTEEFFTKADLLGLVSKYNFEIDGVDSENKICVVKKKTDTVRLFKQGKVQSNDTNKVPYYMRTKLSIVQGICGYYRTWMRTKVLFKEER